MELLIPKDSASHLAGSAIWAGLVEDDNDDIPLKQAVACLLLRSWAVSPEFCSLKVPFVNPLSSRSRVGLLERVACAVRRGEYSYISLECALSEWGVISQIPQSYLTVVTTGRKGVFSTPYGVIEFTHTQRSAAKILKNTVQRERPLRIATAPAALRDLRRVGRNLHLVDLEEMQEHYQD